MSATAGTILIRRDPPDVSDLSGKDLAIFRQWRERLMQKYAVIGDRVTENGEIWYILEHDPGVDGTCITKVQWPLLRAAYRAATEEEIERGDLTHISPALRQKFKSAPPSGSFTRYQRPNSKPARESAAAPNWNDYRELSDRGGVLYADDTGRMEYWDGETWMDANHVPPLPPDGWTLRTKQRDDGTRWAYYEDAHGNCRSFDLALYTTHQMLVALVEFFAQLAAPRAEQPQSRIDLQDDIIPSDVEQRAIDEFHRNHLVAPRDSAPAPAADDLEPIGRAVAAGNDGEIVVDICNGRMRTVFKAAGDIAPGAAVFLNQDGLAAAMCTACGKLTDAHAADCEVRIEAESQMVAFKATPGEKVTVAPPKTKRELAADAAKNIADVITSAVVQVGEALAKATDAAKEFKVAEAKRHSAELREKVAEMDRRRELERRPEVTVQPDYKDWDEGDY